MVYLNESVLKEAVIKLNTTVKKLEQDVDLPNHTRAVEILLDKLVALGNCRFLK